MTFPITIFFISYVSYMILWDDTDNNIAGLCFAGLLAAIVFFIMPSSKTNTVYSYRHNDQTGGFCLIEEKTKIDFCGNANLSEDEKRITRHGDKGFKSITEQDRKYMLDNQSDNTNFNIDEHKGGEWVLKDSAEPDNIEEENDEEELIEVKPIEEKTTEEITEERVGKEIKELKDNIKGQTTIDKDEKKAIEKNLKEKIPELDYEGW